MTSNCKCATLLTPATHTSNCKCATLLTLATLTCDCKCATLLTSATQTHLQSLVRVAEVNNVADLQSLV
jgi:hypothetical protein